MSDIRAHSTWQTLTLHLLPGALITAFYFLAGPLVLRAGYPWGTATTPAFWGHRT
jgi:hypothetical protein